MLNWAQQQLANVAGTQEPFHGPDAIQSVSKQVEETPYTELKKEDLKWTQMDKTNVETQTFYVMADSGHMAIVQVIYSNVMGLNITAQFNTKIFYPDSPKTPNLWSSDALKDFGFSDDMYNFHAKNCALELSEDGTIYKIKSATNHQSIVDLQFKRTTPGVMMGKNGTSFFGTDPQNPWGRMRHAFWPMCETSGTILTKAGQVNFKGRGVFIHALQGMKPHHAAARWNFVDFQTPSYAALMMEFTTPASYGTTTVNVGMLTTRDAVLYAGATNSATHTATATDPEPEWAAPTAARYEWRGTSGAGTPVAAVLEGDLGERLDRVDIMAEVPRFVKQIVAGAAGTKPYIYQYGPRLTLKVTVDGKESEEEGKLFTEATFIS